MTQAADGPVVVIGAGDHGRVLLDLLRARGDAVIGFVKPSEEGAAQPSVDDVPVLGDLEQPGWVTPGMRFVVALGDNAARRGAYERCLELGLQPAIAVHPTATLLSGARVEPGAAICARAVIGVAAWVGPNALVNTAATLDHDDRIEAHANVSPGAHLAGRVTVGEGAYIGIGASVREGTLIGAWALVAGGAVVIRDVPPGARVAGVPARPMGDVER
jgi:sugar O-acyltransferase (sialic acid O-acetyltransferase NeuD family)